MKSWPPSFAAVAVTLIVIAGAGLGVALIEHRTALAIVRPDDPPRAPTPSLDAPRTQCAASDPSLRCPAFDHPRQHNPGLTFPEVVENFEIVHMVPPQYPHSARLANVHGKVTLQVGVKRDGTVGGVCVLAPARCGLDTAAVAAVKQWKFRISGRPRNVVVPVEIEFPPQ